MGGIAFVFPGQGAQKPGMGMELSETLPAARAVFQRHEALRPGTIEQCFGGSEALLSETLNAQPCLYTLSLAIAEALGAQGVRADMAAGFSLGEVSALAYAGLFRGDEGFRFVIRRADIMQALNKEHPGAMAAILKLPNETVEALCREIGSVYPVNYNSPGQLVAAGTAEAIDKLAKAAALAGGRTMPLKVSGAFHSPHMDEAEALLADALNNMKLGPLSMPVYSNLTAKPYENDPISLLSKQVNHPVRWQQSVEQMIHDGADTFIELGGSLLGGMIRRISGSVTVLSIEDSAGYEAALALLKGEGRYA